MESLKSRLTEVLQVVSVLRSLLSPRLVRIRVWMLLSVVLLSGLRWMVSTTEREEHRMVVVRLKDRSWTALVEFLAENVELRASSSSSLARREVALLAGMAELSMVQTLSRVVEDILRKVAIRWIVLVGVEVPQSLIVVRVRWSTALPRLLLVKVQASEPQSGTSQQVSPHTPPLRRSARLVLEIGALLPASHMRLSRLASPSRTCLKCRSALRLTLPVPQALLHRLTSREVQSLVRVLLVLASRLFSVLKWALMVVHSLRPLRAPRVIQLSMVVALLELVLAATALPRKSPMPAELRLEEVSPVVDRQVPHRVSRQRLEETLIPLTELIALGAERM